MPTSKTLPDKKSTGPKVSLVIVAVVVVFLGIRWTRGSMMLGYVDSAIGRMRTLNDAEAQFAHAHPSVGFTCALSQLPSSGEIQRLLRGNGIDNGYAFEITGCQESKSGKPNSSYYTSARPLHSGQPAFCSDQSGILKADYSGSVAKCHSNGVPL
jgi:hypothetical protein